MLTSKAALKAIAQQAILSPKEEMLEVRRNTKSLYIGVPRELSFQENRVPLIPDAVHVLVNNGHEVVIESNAGINANFQDRDYSEAGARICYDRKEVYKANVILKVGPPEKDEIELLTPKQTIISALQLSVQPRDHLRKLMDKKITAIAWDYIRDEEGIFPIVRAMGEIAGNTAILIASEYLSKSHSGQGLMLGGISGVAPSEVVIIGAGTVGEYAARAALGLGASVKVFDNSIYRLRRLQNDLGARLWTSVIQPDELKKALVQCDVAVGALRARESRAPTVVTEDMVRDMKYGAVIVDISIDMGGCFETSEVTNHTHPVFRKYGVIHYCVPNVASRVSRTASYALSNVFTPLLLAMGERGGVTELIRDHSGFRNGVYVYNGTLTSELLGEAFNLPYKDIDLLFAAI